MNEKLDEQMSKLKNRVKGLISKNNVLDHEVLWRYDDVIHPKLHKEYLDVRISIRIDEVLVFFSPADCCVSDASIINRQCIY